jgi:hypothetical protein
VTTPVASPPPRPPSRVPVRWRVWLTWSPVAVLLGAAASHAWLVHQHRLSPWLGAGFGMFASTDVGLARSVHLTALLADGQERPLRLPEPFDEVLARTRSLPTPARIEGLAEIVHRYLLQDPPEAPGLRPTHLRIEVWRNHYEPGSLQPRAVLLARELVALGPGGA